MKNKTTKFLTIFLATLLLSKVGFAEYLEGGGIAREAQRIASQLKELAHKHANDPCAGDLELAADFIAKGQQQIAEKHWVQALTTMTYGQDELKAISRLRPYCKTFALPVKPFIKRTSILNAEIAILQKRHP